MKNVYKNTFMNELPGKEYCCTSKNDILIAILLEKAKTSFCSLAFIVVNRAAHDNEEEHLYQELKHF